jgi:hypothetical protein
VRNESGLSGPGKNRTEDIGTDLARRPVLLAPESSGRRRDRTVLCFIKAANGNVMKGWQAGRFCQPRGRENL